MPPPPPEEPPAPKTELEELQLKADQVTDESLASTRRMRALCDEAKEAGIKTLVALDDQGEQLDHIEQGMIQINEDMREAEKNLQGMEACCGICALPCKKNDQFKEDAGTWKGNDDGKVGGGPQQRMGDANGIPTYGGFVSKITNDAREDEMEKNMEEVDIMVGNLRNMALDMGNEIGNQNQQIDRINLMAASNEVRISMANERANKLLK